MAVPPSATPPARPPFQPARALGPSTPPAAWTPARAPVPAGRPRVGFMSPTTPRITLHALLGIGLVFLCILGLVLNSTLPWLWVKAGASVAEDTVSGFAGDSETMDKGEMERSFDHRNTDYVADLIKWPTYSFVFGLVVGVALILVDLIPSFLGVQRILQGAFLTVGAFFGFLLLLTGFRWLGLFLVHWWGDDGSMQFTLHAVPYLNLVLGAVYTYGCFYLLRRLFERVLDESSAGALGEWAVTGPTWTIALVALVLLVSPLAPYTRETPQGGGVADDNALGEADLATYENDARRADALREPAQNLQTARTMLWLMLFFSIAALAFGLIERTGASPLLWGILAQSFLLAAIPFIVGLIFTILFYVNIPKMEGESFFAESVDYKYNVNWFLPLGLVVLGFVLVRYALNVTAPFAKRIMEQQQATRPAPATPP